MPVLRAAWWTAPAAVLGRVVTPVELEERLRALAGDPVEDEPSPGWVAAFDQATAALLSLPAVVDVDLWLLPGWSRLHLLEVVEAWSRGVTGCEHAPDYEVPGPGLAVAWASPRVVCGPCAVAAGRCQECSVCGGPAAAWPVLVFVPLGLVVAACGSCMRDFPTG